MLATLSPDTGEIFQTRDSEKQLREQQLKLAMVLALGFSLLLHFFLLLFVFPAFSIDPLPTKPQTNEPRVLELSLVKKARELPAASPGKTEEEVVENTTLPEPPAEQSLPAQELQIKEEAASLLFPTAQEPSTDNHAERIFNPRLRQQFYNSRPASRNKEPGIPVEVHGSQYYELGNGECLREMENHGITSRDSEEFLIYNVRKVACPGAGNESEGDAMIRGLRTALGRRDKGSIRMHYDD